MNNFILLRNNLLITNRNNLFKILISNIIQKSSISSISNNKVIINDNLKNENNKKHPLLDTFGRYHNYLRISVTERCNLRCVYCMPEEGVVLTPEEQLLSLDEYKKLIYIFSELGITKLRITGGEPTVYKGLIELIKYAKSLNKMTTIGITTNGMKLKTMLPDLVNAGLNSINISIDTLNEEKFELITRRDRKGLQLLCNNIMKAMQYPSLKVKLNCVVTKGLNDNDVIPLINWVNEINNNYFNNHKDNLDIAIKTLDLRFIELMPFDSNNWKEDKCISYLEIIELCKKSNINLLKGKKKHIIQLNSNNNEKFNIFTELMDENDTTKWYNQNNSIIISNLLQNKDILYKHTGNIGFITSMSEHFCSTCNRLRITANGELKVCLFDVDGSEKNSISLLSLIRSNQSTDNIIKYISDTVKLKKEKLGGLTDHSNNNKGLADKKNRPMILIGG